MRDGVANLTANVERGRVPASARFKDTAGTAAELAAAAEAAGQPVRDVGLAFFHFAPCHDNGKRRQRKQRHDPGKPSDLHDAHYTGRRKTRNYFSARSG